MNSRGCVGTTTTKGFHSTSLDGPSLEQIQALFYDVQLNEAAVPVLRVANAVEFFPVQAVAVERKSE
jgi:hypothetical protein